MNSGIFKLDLKDVAKGAVTALLAGFTLPILAMVQTPGFDIFAANWHQVGVIAINGAVAGFVAYIVKNFFSTSDGKVLGSIG